MKIYTVSCGCYHREELIDLLRLVDNMSVMILEQSKKMKIRMQKGKRNDYGLYHSVIAAPGRVECSQQSIKLDSVF